MANKGRNIVNIPLAGDLNLSTNKLDVISPGDSGYLKNNGHIYGNILSPIYLEKTSRDTEWYDSDGNRYEIGNTSLVKNSHTVMNYSSNGLKQTKLDLVNVKAYDNDTYLRQEDNKLYIKMNAEDTQETSINFEGVSWHISEVLAARMIASKGALVLYVNNLNQYILGFFTSDGQMVSIDTEFSGVNSPMISLYLYGSNRYILSVFSDSGEKFNGTVKTYVLDTSTVTYTISPCDYNCTNSSTSEITTTTRHRYDEIVKQGFTFIRETEGLELLNAASSVFRMINNFTDSGNISVKMYYHFFADRKTFTTMRDTDLSEVEIDTSSMTGNIVDLGRHTYSSTSYNYSEKSYLLGTVSSPNEAVSIILVMKDLDADTALDDPFIPVIYGDATEKKGLGMYWFEISYTSNGSTVTKKFKYFPNNNTGLDTDDMTAGFSSSGLMYEIDSGEELSEEEKEGINVVSVTTVSDKPKVKVNAILDSGKLVCTNAPETSETTFTRQLFGFTGDISSVSYSNNTYHINYTVTSANSVYLGLAEDPNCAYPWTFVTRQCSLGKDYFRYSLITKGYKVKDSETEADTTVLTYDSGFDKIFLNAGYNTASNTVGKGSMAVKDHWRILYNNNHISNVSYGTSDEIGTILFDWDLIEEVLDFRISYIVVRDTYGNVFKFTSTTPDSRYFIISDRYIVINTVSYYNCYDTKTGRKYHFASDYNNRFMEGIPVSDYLKQTEDNNKVFSDNTLLKTAVDGSAQNAAYTITNIPLGSVKYAPELLSSVFFTENPVVLKGNTPDIGIEIYLGIGEVTAVYQTSFKRNVYIKDNLLEGAYFTNDVVYNPNIFSRFIHTYTVNDMIVNEGTNTAYQLIKYNGQIFLMYFLKNGLENAENVFVIQTLVYYMTSEYIFEVYYDNSVPSNFNVVANIKNMKYIGSLPTAAIFWSPKDKSFWSFGGDAVLRKVIQATDIDEIKGQWYDTSNQYLYIATDIGLLCLNETNNFLIDNLKNVSAMWFMENYFIAKNTATVEGTTETNDWKISFTKDVLNVDGVIKIQTKYFGSIENFKLHFDCLYFRLMNDGTDNPYFKIKCITLTDIGTETEEKNIAVTFDEVTGTAYLRYQQKYQTAVACSYRIETNCPIVSWSIGYAPTEEQAQISVISI